MSFPNPVVVSFDRGLISHIGRSDIIEIPFYDDKFVDSIEKRISPTYVDFYTEQQKIRPANRMDALVKWLATEALKLTTSQTLVLDGSTGIEKAFHQQYWTDPELDDKGVLKYRTEWNRKLNFFTEIAMSIKSVQCNVIYICHEAADRNDKGDLNGGVRPLITGQFQDQLVSHFNNWFRCLTVAKPAPEKVQDFKNKFLLNEANYKEWIASTTTQTIYLWQTQSDELAKCGTSLIGAPKFILANYNQFNKYKKKI